MSCSHASFEPPNGDTEEGIGTLEHGEKKPSKKTSPVERVADVQRKGSVKTGAHNSIAKSADDPPNIPAVAKETGVELHPDFLETGRSSLLFRQ